MFDMNESDAFTLVKNIVDGPFKCLFASFVIVYCNSHRTFVDVTDFTCRIQHLSLCFLEEQLNKKNVKQNHFLCS